MAYNLSAPPSSSLSFETSLFCTSLTPPKLLHLRTPKNLIFHFKLRRPNSSFHISASVSLQESVLDAVTQDSEIPSEKTIAPSKSYIWVNPKNPKAAKLRQKSRYACLRRIAASLNSCLPLEDAISGLLDVHVDKILEQEAVVILNYMSNKETAPLVLDYFLKKLKMRREVVLYNVTLKVFRKCKDMIRAENLFNLMLERGVKPDNITFSTIISCARLCSLPKKAVEWFEKMPSFGCEPDHVTCFVMIDVYGRVGNVEVALSMNDRARSEKWCHDPVTFSALIKIYCSEGNYNWCLNLYEEMTALGVKPDASVYNALLEVMGIAKRPWQAIKIYRQMVRNEVEPTWETYAALIKAYGRAGYGIDAIVVYKEMREKGFELSVLLYNILLSTCADVGFTDEAAEILQDMRSSGIKPDNWTYASLITISSCSGKVEEAEATLKEMLEAGFEPNIFIFTSMIQCYGKAGRMDDVVRTSNQVLESSIVPDALFCGSLLNVLTQVPKEELGKLTTCIENANPKLGYVVKLIVEEENIEGEIEIFRKEARELLESIGTNVKKAYCNCLIDLCVSLNQLERASELLHLGLALEIYTHIMSRTPTQWSLHLKKSLSLGAALTALHVWMNDLSKAVQNGEELPELLGINTGHGKHKFSEKGLAWTFESHLKELNAPFQEMPYKVGWFLTTKVAAVSWLESRQSQEAVLASSDV